MPLATMDQAHAAGVNGLAAGWLPSGFATVLSAGDDQTLRAAALRLPETTQHSSAVEPSPTQPPAADMQTSVTQPSHGRRETAAAGGGGERDSRVRADGVVAAVTHVANAHSSALRAVWTNGRVVLTVGLDQRVRCWHLSSAFTRSQAQCPNPDLITEPALPSPPHMPSGASCAAGVSQTVRQSDTGRSQTLGDSPAGGSVVLRGSMAAVGEAETVGEEGSSEREHGLLLQQVGSTVSQVLEPACVTAAPTSDGKLVVAVAGRGLQMLTWQCAL